MAEAVERQIQPNECVFELSGDQTKYQLRVPGGNSSIIAWATNDPNWGTFEPNYLKAPRLIINIRQDILKKELTKQPLKRILKNKGVFAYPVTVPAINYHPQTPNDCELSFILMPVGFGFGNCRGERPMSGYSLVTEVLTVAVKVCLNLK